MKRMRMTMVAATAVGLCGFALFGTAGELVLKPRVTTTQWRTHLPDAPIQALHVWVRKAGGGSDAFFNMRFGRDGHTFDGRRVYLGHNDLVKASWDLQGRTPEGKELILNAYHGSVHIEQVVVVHAGRGRPHPAAYRQRNDTPPPRDGYDAYRGYPAQGHSDRGEPYRGPVPRGAYGYDGHAAPQWAPAPYADACPQDYTCNLHRHDPRYCRVDPRIPMERW
jgi:hypothetical protein